MKPAWAAAVMCLLATAAPAAVEAPSVRTVPAPGGGAERIEALLPGRLLHWTVPAGGARGVIMLLADAAASSEAPEGETSPCQGSDAAAPAGGPHRTLWRLDLKRGTLDRVAVPIPEECGRLLSEGEETLVVCEGGLRRAGSASEGLLPLLSDPGIIPHGLLRTTGDPSMGGAGILALQRLGEARFYRREQGEWTLLASPALPLSVTRHEGSLTLETASLKPVGLPSAGRPLYAFGPQRHGASRLRTILLDPAVGEPDSRREVWSRLPRPEIPLATTYALLDGRPALIVASRSAEKLSLFGEQRLRLFLLDEKDRSRTGAAPLLAVESRANLWQTMHPRVVDLDGDGRQDLVTAYWKGLKDTRLVLDAWMRRSDGSFGTSPASTELDVPHASRGVLSYGADIDGDGLGDLVVHAAGRLHVHPGIAPRSGGRGIVDARARWSIEANVPSTEADVDFGFSFDDQEGVVGIERGLPPQGVVPLDLDGDGRMEIVIPRGETPGLFAVVRFSG